MQYFAYLHSLYFDGDLDFRNEYQHFADIGLKNGDPAVFNALLRDNPQDPPLNPQTGVYRNVAPIGSALLWSPGFVLADPPFDQSPLLPAGPHARAASLTLRHLTHEYADLASLPLDAHLQTLRTTRRHDIDRSGAARISKRVMNHANDIIDRNPAHPLLTGSEPATQPETKQR